MASNVTSAGHLDRGLFPSKNFTASTTPSTLCPNISRGCGASGTIPHRQTEGFMATVVMVFLLCLVIAYCCWGACCKLLKKRRACTEDDDDDETAGYSSESSYPSTVTSAALQNETRVPRCAYRTRTRGPKPARPPQIPPPTYESIFGTESTAAPPSYSMLDLSPTSMEHASDCEDATLLAGQNLQRTRIAGAESSSSTDGSFSMLPKRFSSSGSLCQLGHLSDALQRAN